MRSITRRGPFAALLAALISAGCIPAGATTPDDADVDARADADEAASTVDSDVATADGKSDGTTHDAADTRADATASSDAIAKSDAADADVEGPPPGPPVCGDGWRDPATEECDDSRGPTDDPRRGCSPTCQVKDLLGWRAPAADSGVASGATRSLGEGRHPVAASPAGDYAVAFVESSSAPSVRLTSFDRKGFAHDEALAVDTGTTALLASNPVVAGVAAGRFLVSFTDFNGDGDEQGVAIRTVDVSTGTLGPLAHANTTTAFSQFDSDLVVVGALVIVAWTDASSSTTGTDIKIRSFDTALTPTSTEQTLAGTTAAESDVALAPLGATWIAAWKSTDAALETLHARTGSTEWTVGPYLAGPSLTRPALVELDATHVLAVVLEARDSSGGGVPTYALHGAVLDLAAPGAAADFELVTATASDAGLATSDARDVNAMRVGDQVLVAWRTTGAPGDPAGDDLWLKPLTWAASALDHSLPEIRLPRRAEHTPGDQRRPALAATMLPPGGALVAAWDDFGRTLPTAEANQDIVVEMIPIPVLRGGTP